MKKLLAFVDTYLLKFGVLLTLLFVAWYPKLPSIHIVRTWVYIRLEDFVIAAVVLFWIIQLLRRKVKLPFPVGIPIGAYWLVGFCSLLFSLIITGPHLAGFFPHLAILEYGRRIEYMILFFVAFSTIRSVKDLRDYCIVLCVIILGVVIYGFGQRYYLDLWAMFPKFFEKYPFCFPSFQTGNEEFAKGLALCLPKEARIPATFGGHYDLAGYLVIVLPILLGIFFSIKKRIAKIGVSLLFLLSLILLLLTASRVSFFSYLLGVSATLIFLKRKKWLIPVLGISILFLLIFSGSTAKRLLETFRIVNVVTNNQGQVVGIAQSNLPDALKNKVSKTDSVIVEAPPPTQNLPTGSSFITLPQTSVATNTALVKTSITTAESLRLKLANGGLQISTISGSFLIQKALVYDISFTTRFQAEWPNAWAAYMSNPALGKGYSTITLATDNDYLRLLGETGFLGFISFILIFIVFGIFLRETVLKTASPLTKTFTLGLAGGVIGLFANAALIDVFEASKVAEPLWILLGVAVGGLSLEKHESIPYIAKLKKVFTSHIFLVLYLLIAVLVVFGGGLNNFFAGDDFVWLKWAANTGPHQFGKYFLDASGTFYRPLDKIIMYFLYTLFSFQPQGYHVFWLFIHFFIGLAVYLLGLQIFKKKLWAWMLAIVYLVLPIHAEVLFWMSTMPVSLGTLFMTYSLWTYVMWRKNNRVWVYVLSLFFALLGIFSYEMAVTLPLILFATDLYLHGSKNVKNLAWYVPYIVIDIVYLLLRSSAHVASAAGDYVLSLPHLLANTVGNFVGYVVVSFFGEGALTYHVLLRQGVRPSAYLVEVMLGLLLITLAVILFKAKKKVGLLLHNENILLALFGFAFAFISLLPFLGLGTMAERYGYLAGIGFACVFVAIFRSTFGKARKNMRIAAIIAGAVVFLLFKGLVNTELVQWQKASDIAFTTLGYFRIEHPEIQYNSTIYMVNVPTRYGTAWVFPVGLPEGLWFIYRNPSLRVVVVSSIEKATELKKQHPSKLPAKDYMFDYDKDYNIVEHF